MDIKNIAIIGAGQMGNGIALVAATKGYNVTLHDDNDDILSKADDIIRKDIKRLEKRKLIDDIDITQVMNNITFAQNIETIANSDIVIEAIIEDEDLKRELLKKICMIVGEHTIIASNTSSISITRLGSVTNHPERFCGMHFMNPVPMMPLVELISGLQTSDETFQIVNKLSKNLGKTVAVAEDFPGFIVNRILLPMINEAVYALYEGVGSVSAIDTAMKLGTRHPLGPLELADYIGLDTCLAILNTLYNDLADTKYRPCPLLMKYVEAGWLGVKSGRGFYDYGQDEPRPTR